jgi:hypothetical protein
MNLLPEKLVEFFSAPSSATEIYEKISPEVAEVAGPRPGEIRAGVINIINHVGVREVSPAPVVETASHMGRLAQTEATPEIKTDPTQTTTTSLSPEVKTGSIVNDPAATEAEAYANVMALYGSGPSAPVRIEDENLAA